MRLDMAVQHIDVRGFASAAELRLSLLLVTIPSQFTTRYLGINIYAGLEQSRKSPRPVFSLDSADISMLHMGIMKGF
jgi:hypothetical protein